MEQEEYRLMYELEDNYWWCRGLRDLLASTIQRTFGQELSYRILDAGCGTGSMLKSLNRYERAFGVDVSEVALEYCRRRKLRRILRASTSALPFCDGSFDMALSIDVLCQRAVNDDMIALSEIHRILKKDGILLINLPAHDHLRRDQDESAHNRQRYSLDELACKIKKNRFRIIKISYRCSFLLPVIALIALINRNKKKEPRSELKHVARPVNFILYRLLVLENRLMEKLNIPFGSSIFCVARKLS